jgi:YbgC/YbaW family acyl-CoA thioester hydrolase
MTRRVQFSETDMAGVMHFANYFRWLEEVEHAFFRERGLSIVMPHEGSRLSWPRVAASCEYTGPLHFEDEIELRLRLTRVGTKSLSYEVRFLKAGQLAALGKITSVCVLIQDHAFAPIPIPPAIREKLEKI